MIRSGELIIRVVEEVPPTPYPNTYIRNEFLVVEEADPIVLASYDDAEACRNYITGDVLEVGTPGHGLGIVRYRVEARPANLADPGGYLLTKLEEGE